MTIIATSTGTHIVNVWVEDAMANGQVKVIEIAGTYAKDADYHRSAFQKCIRRGNAGLALHHGNALRAADEKSAWFALSVIAGEDVGIGNPAMVALSLLCVLKTFRSAIGNDDRLFKGLVFKLANSYKNRFGCQLNVFADQQTKSTVGVSGHPDEDLIEALSSTNLVMQFFALRELRKRCRHGNIELLNRVIVLIKQTFPNPSIGLAAALCFERATDALHYGLVITMATVFAGSNSPPLVKEDPDTELHKGDDPLPNSAVTFRSLDQHTNIGRMAINRWAKTDYMVNLAKGYGIALGSMNKALGAVTFFKEASLVTPKLRIEDEPLALIEFKQEQEYTNARADVQLTMAEYTSFAKAVMHDLDSLHEIRNYLWVKAS